MAFCLGLLIGYNFLKFRLNKNPVDDHSLVDISTTKLKGIDSLKLIYTLRFAGIKDSLFIKAKKQSDLITKQKKELLLAQNRVEQELYLLKVDGVSKQDTCFIDSLSIAIRHETVLSDTLSEAYELKLKLYTAMVAVRDSELVFLNKSYADMHDVAKEQALKEQQLTTDLNTTLKSLRRKRIQNRLLAGGMLFISGVTTTLFIKSRQ